MKRPLSLLVPLCLLLASPLAAAPRPNIIVILSDDMGISDIGCYGGEIATPNLDSLAAGGLRYSQFYNTARCCPTRASLLTGLYPHQAGIGHMMEDRNLPGYQGDLNRQCVTIAEVLRPAGYRNYACGKWHVTKKTKPETDADRANWPLQRGFDRFYGTIHGAGSFYDPNTLTRDNAYISPFVDPEYRPADGVFYYTDAINDQASRFVREHAAQHAGEPFFLYVAHTAAHWPMHALERDLAKYRGRYDAGYEVIRAARYDRMKAIGLIDDRAALTPLGASWSEVTNQAYEARCMEVYAAMVDCMDQGIGRIVSTLKETNQFENTLIFYLQDNGGCAEGMGRNGEYKPRPEAPTLKPLANDYLQPDMIPKQTRDGYPVRQGDGILPGGPDTYHGYGQNWATVSNTPFREYKHWVHEGGIATPLIAHWPAGLPRRNEWERTPAHLIDIMATCVEVSGARYPETFHGEQRIHPLEGRSLVPTFSGRPVERDAIYWEHEGNRAIRVGDWKLVAKGATGPWELYDLAADRSETHDLAAEKPELTTELSKKWEEWATRALAKPWPWDGRANRAEKIDRRKRQFRLAQGETLTAGNPDVAGRGFTVKARVEEAGSGVILAQGGVAHGWSVYLTDDLRPAMALRRSGKLETITGETAVPAAPFDLGMTLSAEGRVTMTVAGKQAIHSASAGLLTNTPQDGLSAGLDANDPVGDYVRENAFSGRLGAVELELRKP
ncbi:MAG: arylsulfatase [Verrucomicrobiales bacterium]|nr:arylsulfatase [Verrucomicrobiales bacterium]